MLPCWVRRYLQILYPFVDCSLYQYAVPFFVCCSSFCFNIYFVWCKYCYPSFLSLPFARSIFFHPFTFSFWVPLGLKCVSCRQHINGSCFFSQSATLCFLIRAFSSLTFEIAIDKYVLIATLLLFSECFSNFSLFLSSSLALFLCSLMSFFNIMFGFLLLNFFVFIMGFCWWLPWSSYIITYIYSNLY